MELLDVVTAARGRISGGDPYLWSCFGDNANFLEFRDVDAQGFAHCIYDTETYEVYQVHVEIPRQDTALLWTNPKYISLYLEECKHRNVDPAEAWDDVKYHIVEQSELILGYIKGAAELNYSNFPLTLEMPGTMGSAKLIHE